MTLHLALGDITLRDDDAIVNAAPFDSRRWAKMGGRKKG